MNKSSKKYGVPRKIICLTEESVETLYLLGQQHLIVGASVFVKRPVEARNLPKVSAFTSSKIETIVAMQPDLVLGFSDIQKDIARDLIGAGLNVWIANHRTLEGVLDYVRMLGRIVGCGDEALRLTGGWERLMQETAQESSRLSHRPKVYFEEWDEPQISAIRWVSELITLCGGKDIFEERSFSSLAQGRFTTAEEVVMRAPEIIMGCWCGKKVRLESFAERAGWLDIPAIKNQQVYEMEPEIFLQPGPALFVDGIREMRQKLHP